MDQVKHVIGSRISQFHKQLRGRVSEDEWKEFESWFWKIRPLTQVDYTKYGNSIRIYDPPDDVHLNLEPQASTTDCNVDLTTG